MIDKNDTMYLEDLLIEVISLLTEIKDLLKADKQSRESKLPRSI